MNWTLEVVKCPVTDLDRAITFYRDKVGFNLDFDTKISDSMRVIQLTPPGSGCSIVMGIGIGVDSPPGTLQAQLVVPDIEAARKELVERGVDVSDIKRFNEDDGGAFVFFDDPDGNNWGVQEIRARAQS